MSRDDIIKGLECCYSNRTCDGCPYSALADCRRELERNTFSLFKELTEDNENLNQSCTNLIQTIKDVQADTVRKVFELIKESLPQLLMESSYLDVLDEEQWIPAADQLLNGIKEMLDEESDIETDKVAVVRCKDCKHFRRTMKGYGECHLFDEVKDDEYCSSGERIDGWQT